MVKSIKPEYEAAIKSFVEEKCVCGIDYTTSSTIFYRAFNTWCFDKHLQLLSNQEIVKGMELLGFRKKQLSRFGCKQYFMGVKQIGDGKIEIIGVKVK